jgi:hypothetical protein
MQPAPHSSHPGCITQAQRLEVVYCFVFLATFLLILKLVLFLVTSANISSVSVFLLSGQNMVPEPQIQVQKTGEGKSHGRAECSKPGEFSFDRCDASM